VVIGGGWATARDLPSLILHPYGAAGVAGNTTRLPGPPMPFVGAAAAADQQPPPSSRHKPPPLSDIFRRATGMRLARGVGKGVCEGRGVLTAYTPGEVCGCHSFTTTPGSSQAALRA
jgi:hypothetical protein